MSLVLLALLNQVAKSRYRGLNDLETTFNHYILSKRIYCATIALLFGRVVSVPVVHAGAPDGVVLVPPT